MPYSSFPRAKTLVPRQTSLFTLSFIKSHLRITFSDHDELLLFYLTAATDWVEEQLGKTLLKTTRQVSHHNNKFVLPYGPILKITAVSYHKKPLTDKEYTVTSYGDSLEIKLPFYWTCPTAVVTYEAGFGETPEDVPSSIRNAILGTLEYLYENRGELGDFRGLEEQKELWLKAHRTYRLV